MKETINLQSSETEKEKFLQFGKYTKDCPRWLLDKVAKIDNSLVDENYVKEVLRIIQEEFNPRKHEVTRTNNLRVSRLISVSDVLAKRLNSCGAKATVVASVFRNLKIPTKLIHGLFIEDNPEMRHA
jgi:hypothetical protein